MIRTIFSRACNSLIVFVFIVISSGANSNPTHGIATYGDLKYGHNFTHFDYVNPKAPKEGTLVVVANGSFDSFNPYIIKGVPAAGSQMLHCALASSSEDEPSSVYGYLAEKMELAPDRRSILFSINPQARFSDGSNVTSDDVIFSFKTLMEKGSPVFTSYYQDVERVEKVDGLKVRFVFKTDKNKELPTILGQLPIFSQAYYSKNPFEHATLNLPIGCGPYKVSSFKAGQHVNYALVPNWWGTNLPSQVGQNNFNVKYLYNRDQNIAFEGFKAGEYDFRSENIAKNWSLGYDIPAVHQKEIILVEAPNKLPAGMQMFVYNIRRPLFADIRVRKALMYAFDFEWANKNLFFNAYTRAASYFNNSPFAATGLPQGKELAILEQFKDKLPSYIFTEEIRLPRTDGTGNNRANLKIADQLLQEAGWIVKDEMRVDKITGKPFRFEFLVNDPAFERIVLAFQRNLKALGINMTVRTVFPSQYVELVSELDYDMIMAIMPQSETPGNEQRDYWGSKKADQKDTRNYAGIKDPIIDQLIELVITSQTREDLAARVKALDRVLMRGYYGIPGWYSKISRYAYWDKFDAPKIRPKDGIGLMTWWVNPQKEKQLKLKKK